MIKKIVKVTHAQMQTLLSGGTVAGHTYDPTHCLYLEDTGADLPASSGSYLLSSTDGGNTFYYSNSLGESIPAVSDGNTIYHNKDLTMNKRNAGLSGAYVNSAQWNRFYRLHYNSAYLCTCNYKGNGSDAVASTTDGLWKASNYNDAIDQSVSLGDMFDSNFTSGATFPVANLSTRPVQITVTKTNTSTAIDATDTNFVMITGWRFAGSPDATTNHFGRLTDYKLELLLKRADNNELEWATTFERTNVSDIIDAICIPIWSIAIPGMDHSQYQPAEAFSYKQFYGIRLTISGATASGMAGQFGFTELRLMETRPAGLPSDAVGALSLGGGTLYGNLVLASKYSNMTIRPEISGTGMLGSSDYRWSNIYGLSGNFSQKLTLTNNVYLTGIRTNSVESQLIGLSNDNETVVGSTTNQTVLSAHSIVYPAIHNSINLGSSSRRWVNVYSNGVQSEKYEMSNNLTLKATMRYNATDECVEFVFD